MNTLRLALIAGAALALAGAAQAQDFQPKTAGLLMLNVRATGVAEAVLDVLSDPSPAVRAAALRSLAAADADNFMAVLSGLDPDPHWSVRAALATTG